MEYYCEKCEQSFIAPFYCIHKYHPEAPILNKENKVTEEQQKEITGRITKVDDKGYGFIISPELPFTRIFFHWTSLIQDTLRFDQIKKGMSCKFIPKMIPDVTKADGTVEKKGWRAIKIKIVDNIPVENKDGVTQENHS